MASDDTRALVGREAEEERVAAAVAAVAGGGSRVLVVSGEPGIGKTALLGDVARRAAAGGLRVLRGRAAEGEADAPFGLAVDVLDDELRALPPAARAGWALELGGVLPAAAAGAASDDGVRPGQRLRVHRALRALLDELGTGGPAVLLLDDLHWADDASLEWLGHLLRRPPRTPHLLVLALRPVAPLPTLLDALRSSVPGEHLELGPLTDEAASRLLADEVTDAERRRRIVAGARGNPLFLTGLARVPDAEERLPPTVQAAVDLEIAPLTADARRALQGAAVAGDPFDADLALAAADLPADALDPLDRLVTADLVRPLHGRSFAFRHPLVRQAVHDGTPLGVRLRAHARVAEVLRRRGAPPERIAHHVERSATVGDADAARLLVAAADAVLGRQPATAAGWLRAALDLSPAAPGPERAELLRALARASLAAGRQTAARGALREALALLDPAALVPRTAVLVALAEAEHLVGRHADARARLRDALEDLPADAPRELRAELTFQLAVTASYEQDGPELRRLAGTAAPALERTAPVTAACDEALGLMAAAWTGHADELAARRAAVRARFDALARRPVPGRPYLGYVLGMTSLVTEDLEGARAAVDDGLAALDEREDDTALVPLTGLWSMVAIASGDARTARRAAIATEEAARLQGAGSGLAQALWLRAHVALLDGDLEDAARAAAEWPAVAEAVGAIHMVRTGHCLFALLRAADDPAAAAGALRRWAGPVLERVEPEWSARRLTAPFVRLLHVLGAADEADRVLDAAAVRTARLGLPVAAAAVERARAEAALATGDAAAAATLAGEAARVAAAHGYAEERHDADLLRARALGRLDRRDEAVALLRALADRAADGGAWAYRDTAARELRRLGSRLPTVLRTAGEEGDLTDRERQIATLAAAGRTNKEVGALLFLSPRTVEHALSRIYAKLGVRGRTELAGAVAAAPGDTLGG